MTVHKQKKNVRQRATTTHGWGAMKKHRGAGNRGGRGNAGSGKRADQNKPSFWKAKYFGKDGFSSKSRSLTEKSINIKDLEDRAEGLVKKGLIKSENGAYIVNLADLGYNKLLSTGKVNKKLIITTSLATAKAVEKIKKAGGEVTVLVAKKKRKQKGADQNKEKDSKAAGKAGGKDAGKAKSNAE